MGCARYLSFVLTCSQVRRCEANEARFEMKVKALNASRTPKLESFDLCLSLITHS